MSWRGREGVFVWTAVTDNSGSWPKGPEEGDFTSRLTDACTMDVFLLGSHDISWRSFGLTTVTSGVRNSQDVCLNRQWLTMNG